MDNTEKRIDNFIEKEYVRYPFDLELSRKTKQQILNTSLMKNLKIWYYMPLWQKLGRGIYWEFPNWPPKNLF